MHGQYVLAGIANTPLLYHVYKVSDRKSFAARAVRVVQEGRTIFHRSRSTIEIWKKARRACRAYTPGRSGAPGEIDSVNIPMKDAYTTRAKRVTEYRL